MDGKYDFLLVGSELPIRESLRRMDKGALQLLIVVDSGKRIQGVITDGDIRRAILGNIDFGEPVARIMSPNPTVMQYPADRKKAFGLMKKKSIKHIPVVNEHNQLVDVILWHDLLEEEKFLPSPKTTPVVIMAGGKGTRLDPFTKILPKPLIPLGDKPVIEIVMDRFKKYGFNKFLISINYKGEMIKIYFSENPNNYQIEYIEEKEFLGTAGALSLCRDRLKETFILSNCDVITDVNFDSFMKFHKENKNHATVFAVIRHMKIPYGVLTIKEGDLDDILEKPEYSYIINTGIYILEPEMTDLIPEGEVMNMPDLLLLAKKTGLRVQVYPMNCSWFDVGEWEEYRRAMDFINGPGGA